MSDIARMSKGVIKVGDVVVGTVESVRVIEKVDMTNAVEYAPAVDPVSFRMSVNRHCVVPAHVQSLVVDNDAPTDTERIHFTMLAGDPDRTAWTSYRCEHVAADDPGFTVELLRRAGVNARLCEPCMVKTQTELHRQYVEQMKDQPGIKVEQVTFTCVRAK